MSQIILTLFRIEDMEEVRIDFVIKQEFRQIFEEKKQHIEELFSVKLEFDRLSEANRNADGFVWLAVIGTLTECNQAQVKLNQCIVNVACSLYLK